MFFDATGDLTGHVPPSPSNTVTIVLGAFSLAAILGSAWLSRRPKRRRTEPAPSPPDLLNTHDRLTVVETHQRDGLRRLGNVEEKVSDHGESLATQRAELVELRFRVKRIEDRNGP